MDRKKKLETSLEGLFSGHRKDPSEDKATPAPEVKPVASSPAVEKKAASRNKPEAAPVETVKTAQAVPAMNKAPEPAAAPEAAPEVKAAPAPAAKAAETPAPAPEPAAMETSQASSIVPAPASALQTLEDEEDETQVLVFRLGQAYYGVEVGLVQTIIKPQPVYLVPGTVDYIRGLINLRGAVVPVVDLRKRFDLPPKENDRETRFVVVDLHDVMASMTVDAVQGVETIPNSKIESPSGMVMNMDTHYLNAVARHNNQLVMILNLAETLRKTENA